MIGLTVIGSADPGSIGSDHVVVKLSSLDKRSGLLSIPELFHAGAFFSELAIETLAPLSLFNQPRTSPRERAHGRDLEARRRLLLQAPRRFAGDNAPKAWRIGTLRSTRLEFLHDLDFKILLNAQPLQLVTLLLGTAQSARIRFPVVMLCAQPAS